MAVHPQHIDSFQQKLAAFVKKHQQLKLKAAKLEQVQQSLLEENEQLKNELEELKQKNLILKSSVSFLDPQEKKEFEKKINQYIGNIDACIHLLTK